MDVELVIIAAVGYACYHLGRYNERERIVRNGNALQDDSPHFAEFMRRIRYER